MQVCRGDSTCLVVRVVNVFSTRIMSTELDMIFASLEKDETNFQNLILKKWISDHICIGNSMVSSDIRHKYHEGYFEIVIRKFKSR